MNPSDVDHDGRRELEQHALRNVSWLAAKLGYQDALDKRQERWLMIAMGVALVVIVAILSMSAMHRSSADGDDLVRKRCEVDARVESTPAVVAQIKAEYPSWAQIESTGLFEQRIHAVVASKCATPSAR